MNHLYSVSDWLVDAGCKETSFQSTFGKPPVEWRFILITLVLQCKITLVLISFWIQDYISIN